MSTLLNKTMRLLSVCLIAILLLCAPAFYYLTSRFYAEDLTEVLEQYRYTGKINTNIDLQEDVAIGMTLHYAFFAVVITIAVLVTVRLFTKKLWKPFNDTLNKIEHYRLDVNNVPTFERSDVQEFSRLNQVISDMINRNVASYKIQKEFTENASHELQTPIAIIRSDLDMLIQEKLNKKESEIIENIYEVTKRMECLNRSLLLLAKIENRQYENREKIALGTLMQSLLPDIQKLFTKPLTLELKANPTITANKTLIQILVNNLVVNALRNSNEDMPVIIKIEPGSFSVSNTSEQGELDRAKLFSRFNSSPNQLKGNGLGLAIVKQICEHYKWNISYTYCNNKHTFTILFS